jgi:hypothetical protein
MPTPIEQSIGIILSKDSKLRDCTPRIYALPDQLPAQIKINQRVRFLDHDTSGGRNVKAWLRRDYGDNLILQQPPFEQLRDQSEIFTTIRNPHERWWSGIRDFMHMLPWYAWWLNEKIMTQWPHFHRATLRIHDIMQEIKPRHLIKVDEKFGKRMENFARKQGLLMYGAFPYNRSWRHTDENLKKMENKGRSQLEAWLKENPNYQKQLDNYLEPDYQYWNQVENQE